MPDYEVELEATATMKQTVMVFDVEDEDEAERIAEDDASEADWDVVEILDIVVKKVAIA